MLAVRGAAPPAALLLSLALAPRASRRGALLSSAADGRPDAEEVVRRVSPINLAYLGDSVLEAAAREEFLWPPARVNELSAFVRNISCAEGQSVLLGRIVDGFGLTADELEWLRRGRNASGRGPNRVSPQVYRASTSLECLVGYLHLTDPARLQQLLAWIFASLREQPLQEPPG